MFWHFPRSMAAALCLFALPLTPPVALSAELNKPGGEKAAVEADLLALTTALEGCALDTTYFVSLETLNDRGSSPGIEPLYDYLNNEGGTWVIRPGDGIFRNVRINLLTAFNAWQGPYINYQQGQTQTGTLPYDQGSPLDPFGNPYLFFTPMGLVRGDIGAITQEFYGDFFDRPTVVCLGPDGVLSGDDVIRQFGTGLQSTALSSLRGANLTYRPASNDYTIAHSSSLQIKGYYFAAAQGSSQVFFGTTELTSHVTSWSDQLITLDLPPTLTGQADLWVVRNGSPTNKQRLTILPNAAVGWDKYP